MAGLAHLKVWGELVKKKLTIMNIHYGSESNYADDTVTDLKF